MDQFWTWIHAGPRMDPGARFDPSWVQNGPRAGFQKAQNENVSKTIGERNNFEGHIATNSGIVQIRLEFVSFLTPQNRHVRAITRIVERAERCKIEEIDLK